MFEISLEIRRLCSFAFQRDHVLSTFHQELDVIFLSWKIEKIVIRLMKIHEIITIYMKAKIRNKT